MEDLVQEFFNIDIMRKVAPLILTGFLQTIVLCVLLIPIGLVGGLLAMLASTNRSRLIRWPAIVFIDLFRSFPPLVLLIFIFAGLPFVGIRLSPTLSICVAFFLNASSYYGEIYRAGVESVPHGQVEAARSTGLSAAQAFIHVTLPQAVRNVLPELLSNTVELVKLTTLASIISAPELLHSADLARSLTFNTSPLVMAGLIYLAMLLPFVRIIRRLEHRLAA